MYSCVTQNLIRMKSSFLTFLFLLATTLLYSQNFEELNDKVVSSFQQGNYVEALTYAQESVKAAKKEFGVKSGNYGISLFNVANIKHTLGYHTEALPLFEEAIKILKPVLGEDDEDFILYQAFLANEYAELERYEEADSVYSDVIVNSEKYFGATHPRYASNIVAVTNMYKSLGLLQEAEQVLLTRIEFLGENLGVEDPSYNLLVNNLGMLYQGEGLYKDAQELFLQAVENTQGNADQDINYGIYLGNLAETYRSLGEYQKAIPVYITSLAYTRKTLGNQSPNYFLIQSNMAMTYRFLGDYEKALSIFFNVKDSTELLYGKDNFNYNTIVSNLAGVYRDIENYKMTLMYIQEAIELTNRNLTTCFANYPLQLSILADVYRCLGKYQESEDTYNEMLEVASQRYGKDNPDYYQLLNNLSILYADKGENRKALNIQLEVLSNVARLLGENHPYNGIYLGNVADQYVSLGEFDAAFEYYDKALINIETNSGKINDPYFKIVNNQALAYAKFGEYEKAQQRYLELKEILEENHVVNQTYNTLLSNLSDLYNKMGKYDKAVQYCEQALENVEKTFGKDHPGYSLVLNNLATIYQSFGQNEKALEMELEAVAKTKKILGENHPSYIQYLNNLSIIYKNLRQYDKALEVIEEVLESARKSLEKQQSSYNMILNNAGTMYLLIEQYDKALPLIQEAILNVLTYHGKDNPDYMLFIGNLALLYSDIGENDKAISLYKEALEGFKNTLGVEHSNYGLQLSNITSFYLKQDEFEKAYPYITESLENIKSQINQNFSFLSEDEKEKFIQSISPYIRGYQSGFSIYYARDNSTAKPAFDMELLTKGLILASSQNMRNNIENSDNPEVLQKFEEWSQKKATLAKQYSLPIVNRSEHLKEWELEAENLEKKLIQLTKNSGLLFQVGKTTWQDVQQKLKPNEVAIEFSNFRVFTGSRWTDTTQYTALILRKNAPQPQLVPLFTQAEMDELLANSGKGVNQVSNLYRGISEVATGPDLAKMYDLVWKPMAQYLKEGETIYFAPSGTLNQIAFSAITTPDGKYLSDIYDLHQVSTTAKLLEETSTEKFTDIALFGGVNYDEDSKTIAQSVQNIAGKDDFVSRSLSEDLNRGGETWSYLQGTLTEVERIQTVAQKGQAKVNYYTGNKATEEQFKALNGKNSLQILHIATHGFFFPDPETKKEDLERMQRIGEQQNMFKLSDNPLNRSGLLFAGANHTWKGEAIPEGLEDGILTAYEASNVALPNTKLVVLSACETGLGDIKGSEGVYGLQRSFKMAGAKYLLMSLWQVPDKETAEFMEYFYGKLFENNDIEASYKATQEYMKGKYAEEPYKWAAFVLVR